VYLRGFWSLAGRRFINEVEKYVSLVRKLFFWCEERCDYFIAFIILTYLLHGAESFLRS
jgi:hypothetical protein